jgi:hypothetical protein
MAKKKSRKVTWQLAGNWILRNGLWVAIGLIVMAGMSFNKMVLDTMLIAVSFECIAIGLSGFAQFCYTKLDFLGIKKSNDRMILGHIFLGVHILMTGILIGVYITQFSGV